jgi:hypothetical protein
LFHVFLLIFLDHDVPPFQHDLVNALNALTNLGIRATSSQEATTPIPNAPPQCVAAEPKSPPSQDTLVNSKATASEQEKALAPSSEKTAPLSDQKAQKANKLLMKVKARMLKKANSKKEASKRNETTLEEVAIVGPTSVASSEQKNSTPPTNDNVEHNDSEASKRKKPDMLDETDACEIAILFEGQYQYWSKTPASRNRKKAAPSLAGGDDIDSKDSSMASSFQSNNTVVFTKPESGK